MERQTEKFLIALIILINLNNSQITSTKYQTNSKSQISDSKLLVIWIFKNWILFGIWKLGFGHYLEQLG